MSTKNSRFMTMASVKSIMSKRQTVPASAEGRRVKFLVQGNGNVIDVTDKDGNTVQSVVEPGTVLQKKIFNVRANSAIAMNNDRNRDTLRSAIAAEKAGDAEKASELYNQYLNSTQISFGVLLPNRLADQLGQNTEIAATVQKITTENGSLLTLDPSSISIVEAASYGTTEFDLADFLGEESTETVTEEVKA